MSARLAMPMMRGAARALRKGVLTMTGFKLRDAVLLGAGVLLALVLFGGSLASLAPLLLVGGCLLMHVFMMRGMDHGGGHGGHTSEDATTTPRDREPR
jgi:hypothetical protein